MHNTYKGTVLVSKVDCLTPLKKKSIAKGRLLAEEPVSLSVPQLRVP